MKLPHLVMPVFVLVFLFSCQKPEEKKTASTKHQKPSHKYTLRAVDTASLGYIETDYAFIYSDIYYYDGTLKYPLANTVSIRNISLTDTAYILKANYYDSYGNFLQNYVDTAIVMAPLESIEFVVEEYESKGGVGANFIIEWGADRYAHQICVQTIVVGIYRQSEISLLTDAKVIGQIKKRE